MSEVYLPETTLGGFSYMPEFEIYFTQSEDYNDTHYKLRTSLSPNNGDVFPIAVSWDGKLYDTNATYIIQADIGMSYFYIGNLKLYPSFANEEDTGEPFFIMTVSGAIAAITTVGSASHTVSIMEKSNDSVGKVSNGRKFILHQMFCPIVARALLGE